MTGKRVVSAGVGQHRAQLSDVHGGEERKKGAHNPYSEEQFAIWKLGSDVARGAQHAYADSISDDNGNAESEAEDSQQSPTPALRTRHFHR